MLNLDDLPKPIKLDIGSGVKTSLQNPDWLGVDAYADCDIKAFMWDLPLPDGSVDTILSSQSLEHISKFNVVPTLREWRRVLRVGGKLQILVPDLEWSCWWWLTHQSVEWDLDILYGTQKHGGEFHLTGFTPKILKDYVDICGGFILNKVEYRGGVPSNLVYFPNNMIQSEISQRIINMELIKDK